LLALRFSLQRLVDYVALGGDADGTLAVRVMLPCQLDNPLTGNVVNSLQDSHDDRASAGKGTSRLSR
jgi:hypothetical protein